MKRVFQHSQNVTLRSGEQAITLSKDTAFELDERRVSMGDVSLRVDTAAVEQLTAWSQPENVDEAKSMDMGKQKHLAPEQEHATGKLHAYRMRPAHHGDLRMLSVKGVSAKRLGAMHREHGGNIDEEAEEHKGVHDVSVPHHGLRGFVKDLHAKGGTVTHDYGYAGNHAGEHSFYHKGKNHK